MDKMVTFLNRRWFIVLFIAAVFVLLLGSSTPSQANAPAEPNAPTDYFVCTPQQVGAFSNRVHVRCSPSAPNNIAYFAACSSSDSAAASRYLSIFTTAKVTGKGVAIYYTYTDTSGTSCGCTSDNCRVIWGAEVMP